MNAYLDARVVREFAQIDKLDIGSFVDVCVVMAGLRIINTKTYACRGLRFPHPNRPKQLK
jgi:hypothetical protein